MWIFYSKIKKIIVELDGTQHRNTIKSDIIRDEYLSSLGYNVIRISYKEYKNKTYENLLLEKLVGIPEFESGIQV